MSNGLIYGFIFDGKGGGKKIDLEEVRSWKSEQGILWLHFDYTSEEAQNWILNYSGLDGVPAEALLTEETRPRTIIFDDAALMALRGVNLNPDSDPEDMVSVRLWIDKYKIISTRRRPLLSISDIADSLKKKEGPKTTGDFIDDLTDWLITRMEGTIEGIEDRLAQLEEDIIDSSNPGLRTTLLGVRRQAIMLRRYLAPQREALTKLYSESLSWMRSDDKIRIREVTDRLIRYLEDLDSARDRASVTQEELANRISEQMNSRMYVLSLVAAIFLPLGFLTGLLGINVGGIPGAENKWAFGIFLIMLVGIVVLQIYYFKKKKWL
ncbi:MAG: zinc transporter ZntB [Thermodesulfobacteriota bacterium]|nr:zinc transporter ZntB [Thermodesulfobacteriota bacterium]